MSRRSIIAFAALATVIGAAAFFVSASWISWRIASSANQEHLDRDAAVALAYVAKVYRNAAGVLEQIADTDEAPCSPQHIRKMLELTEGSLSIVNVAYGAGDMVECNSWGVLSYPLMKSRVASTQPDGIGIVPNWRPQNFGRERSMLVLRQGGYSVLVDQRRFFSDWVGSGSSVIADVRVADGTALVPSFAPSLLPPVVAGEAMTATVSDNGLTVTVRRPAISFANYLVAERTLLLPLAAALVLLFGLVALLWARQRLSLASELAMAVRDRRLTAHYQPIMELATGRCVGVEALARWQREDGTHVSPDVFIPLAEGTGLIAGVTDQVVATVVRDLGDWLRRCPDAHVGINLSAADVSSGRILPALEAALQGSGIRSQQVWLEATERGIIDIAGARSTLNELRRRGHMTAIDDFGTGYAGLSYLQQLPINVLKIDRTFVETVGTDVMSRNVTEHIIGMAHQLELEVVAEGVETEDQATYLREKGVAYAQGWLFSRALPAAIFLAFWESNRQARLAVAEPDPELRRPSA